MLEVYGRIVRPETVERHAAPLLESLERKLLAYAARGAPFRTEALVVHEDDAPGSLDDLLAMTKGNATIDGGAGTIRVRGRMVGERVPVSGAHSTDTIWSGQDVNAIFRAVHDREHVESGHGFDYLGELSVARIQCQRLSLDSFESAIMTAEVSGQALFHEFVGAFPDFQRAFVVACMRFGPSAIARGIAEAVAEWPAFIRSTTS